MEGTGRNLLFPRWFEYRAGSKTRLRPTLLLLGDAPWVFLLPRELFCLPGPGKPRIDIIRRI